MLGALGVFVDQVDLEHVGGGGGHSTVVPGRQPLLRVDLGSLQLRNDSGMLEQKKRNCLKQVKQIAKAKVIGMSG